MTCEKKRNEVPYNFSCFLPISETRLKKSTLTLDLPFIWTRNLKLVSTVSSDIDSLTNIQLLTTNPITVQNPTKNIRPPPIISSNSWHQIISAIYKLPDRYHYKINVKSVTNRNVNVYTSDTKHFWLIQTFCLKLELHFLTITSTVFVPNQQPEIKFTQNKPTLLPLKRNLP